MLKLIYIYVCYIYLQLLAGKYLQSSLEGSDIPLLDHIRRRRKDAGFLTGRILWSLVSLHRMYSCKQRCHGLF